MSNWGDNMAKIEKDRPLSSHTKLNYYECYAKIVLEDVFSEQFCDLIIADKPDLQSSGKCSCTVRKQATENKR